jgi:Family of unknown function (DUF6527)
MMQHKRLEHRFVEHLPERLEAGVLYISMEYATAAHCCCCGCGEEVVTPFTPTDWSMTFDGEMISLSPSIGNWNFACRPHYFIRHGRIVEATAWTGQQVEANRHKDRVAKADHYGALELTGVVKPILEPPRKEETSKSSLIELCFGAARGLWRNLVPISVNSPTPFITPLHGRSPLQ